MKIAKYSPLPIINRLSIQTLIRGWAISSVLGIVIFSFVTITANQIIAEKQEQLIQRTLPLEKTTLHLSSLTSNLIKRHTELITVANFDEYEEIYQEKFLAKEFDWQFQNLRSLLTNEYTPIVNDLERLFQNYSISDERLNNSIIIQLQNNISLDFRAEDFKNHLNHLLSLVEELKGNIHIQSSRIKREINTLSNLEDDFINDQKVSKDFPASLISSYINKEQVLRQVLSLRQTIEHINHLSYLYITEKNKDKSESLKNNEIAVETMIANNIINKIRIDLNKNTELTKKIENIERSFSRILNILTVGNNSIFQLKENSFNLTDSRSEKSFDVKSNIESLLTGFNKLNQLTESIIKKSIADTQSISDISLKIMLLLSALVVFNILLGVYVLNSRIKKPLTAIADAMSLQSQGKLKSKLNTEDMPNDEFAQLTNNFNDFVDSNALLIDKLNKAKMEVLDSQSTTETILENALVGIVHLIDRRFVSINHKFEEMTGFTREELIGNTTEMIYLNEVEFNQVGLDVYGALNRGVSYQGECQLRHKLGHSIWCSITGKYIDNNALEKGAILLYEDITVRKQTENKLLYLANFDTLTELPNRSYFIEKLNQNLREAQRIQKNLSVLFIDLDRFKQVNDTLGHDIGDELLKEVAIRLKSCVRGADIVARLGGDEFTVMLSEVDGISGVKTVAKNILQSLNKPVRISNHTLSVSPSIGISLSPKDGTDVPSLMKNADAAMYHAKKMGRNNYQIYEANMNTASEKRFDMEVKLRQALKNDEFILYYQPQVLTKGRKIIGYEALIRWENDELGLVSPADFVPILEDTGLIVPAGEWIIRTACQQLRQWHDMDHKVKVSINLSALQFYQRNLIEMISGIINEYKVDPKYLDFEITESILMEGTDHSEEMLHQLSNLGVRLALDDFGTGYSSLGYLKRFPIDMIKIDQSFIRDVLIDSSDAAICDAIIDIAKRMGMELVAEGVETEEQFNYLSKRKCKIIQGYLFGRPLPAEQIKLQHEIEEAILE